MYLSGLGPIIYVYLSTRPEELNLYHLINYVSIVKVVSEIIMFALTRPAQTCAYLCFSTSASNLEKARMQIHTIVDASYFIDI